MVIAIDLETVNYVPASGHFCYMEVAGSEEVKHLGSVRSAIAFPERQWQM